MTLFDEVYKIFYGRMVKDKGFFSFRNVPDDQVIELLSEKSFDYMQDALANIYEEGNPQIDFWKWNEEKTAFVEDLTRIEIQLIASTMYAVPFERALITFKDISGYFTSSDVKLFSPAEDRKTFVTMKEKIDNNLERKIKRYLTRDRITNERLSILGGVT